MKNPEVSVIVPVYKAEKDLARCMHGLLAQTLRNIEIILVDDGSPDNSGKMCDEYAAEDSSVRVYHKKNGGVATARQCGVEQAKGKYIIHADPDDWVDPTMVQCLYEQAEVENVDMVICDYYEEYSGKQTYISQRPTSMYVQDVMSDLLLQRLHGSLCNKLVRETCYKKNNVRFFDGQDMGEDLIALAQLLRTDLKVSYLPRAFYHYNRANQDSITTVAGLCYYPQQLSLLVYLKRFLKDPVYDAGHNYMFAYTAIKGFVYGYYSADEFKKQYFDHRHLLFSVCPLKWKWFIYLSAVECYRPLRKVYLCFASIKSLFTDKC